MQLTGSTIRWLLIILALVPGMTTVLFSRLEVWTVLLLVAELRL